MWLGCRCYAPAAPVAPPPPARFALTRTHLLLYNSQLSLGRRGLRGYIGSLVSALSCAEACPPARERERERERERLVHAQPTSLVLPSLPPSLPRPTHLIASLAVIQLERRLRLQAALAHHLRQRPHHRLPGDRHAGLPSIYDGERRFPRRTCSPCPPHLLPWPLRHLHLAHPVRDQQGGSRAQEAMKMRESRR